MDLLEKAAWRRRARAHLCRARAGTSGVTSAASGLTLHHLRRDAFGGTLGGDFVAAPQRARRRACSVWSVHRTHWVPGSAAERASGASWQRAPAAGLPQTRDAFFKRFSHFYHFRRFCPIYTRTISNMPARRDGLHTYSYRGSGSCLCLSSSKQESAHSVEQTSVDSTYRGSGCGGLTVL